MGMRWHDLAFLHWPVPEQALRRLLPPGVELDTFDGTAWLGVVPFRMTGVRPRFVPSIPWFSAFPEINVRTYVTVQGTPGVWFFSLDATSPVAVRGARWSWNLPYYGAEIRSIHRDGWIDYSSRRTQRGGGEARFSACYRPIHPVAVSKPGTLEYWLTERYCLYACGRLGLLRGDIHHLPWPLQAAEVELRANTMTRPIGVELPSTPPVAHFARFLDVYVWWRRRVPPVSSGVSSGADGYLLVNSDKAD